MTLHQKLTLFMVAMTTLIMGLAQIQTGVRVGQLERNLVETREQLTETRGHLIESRKIILHLAEKNSKD